MGLDQYAKAVRGIQDPESGQWDKSYELAYWRKHPNLQGWMERLWNEKGGEGEFNCVEVELSEEDLDNLEDAIKQKDLPATQGFFFGENSDRYYQKEDLEFIESARLALDDGYRVMYNSWW